MIIDDLKGVKCSINYDAAGQNFVLGLLNDYEEGAWRSQKFDDFVWNNIGETALSHKERMSLANSAYSMLRSAANNLRLTDKDGDLGKASEIAEIFLYAVMKHHYAALPVVPKIFYQQNSQDFAKGADSVHIVLDEDNDFTLWMGEAKFYNSIDDARFDAIIQSISNSLDPDKIRKENSIITNLADLGDCIASSTLVDEIRGFLHADTSIDLIKPKLNIPILLLYECEETKSTADFTQNYKEKLYKIHSERSAEFFKKKLQKIGSIHKFSEIKFHIIFFPVPNKEEIAKRFLQGVSHFRS